MKTKLSSIVATLALVLGLATLGYSSQKPGTNTEVVIGKKGVLHLTTSARAGDTTLPPGMYVVQHVEEGHDHMIVFTQLSMEGAAQKQVFMPRADDPGIEKARVRCRIEPVSKKWGRTKLILFANSGSEKEVIEVQIRGEAFKHLL